MISAIISLSHCRLVGSWKIRHEMHQQTETKAELRLMPPFFTSFHLSPFLCQHCVYMQIAEAVQVVLHYCKGGGVAHFFSNSNFSSDKHFHWFIVAAAVTKPSNVRHCRFHQVSVAPSTLFVAFRWLCLTFRKTWMSFCELSPSPRTLGNQSHLCLAFT